MALSKFKLEKNFGPPKLRKVLQSLADAINARQPIEGLGIRISEVPDGRRISLSDQAKEERGEREDDRRGGGGGGDGEASEIYGALNGQPAIFHLLQSAPPDLVEE